MSFKRTKLRDAIYFALVVGATSALSTGAAFAQTTPAAPADAAAPTSVGTIVVTGTRIQSQTVTASSPVTEINAEEFQYSGATRIDDLVNQYPQMNPYFDSVANNPSFGYPILDLRGLGPQRTLVLVDGNRLAPGTGIFPDISIVPTLIVKRVDILTGGASAVYGADAVAGVVNFILDTDFEGVKFSTGISAYRHNNRNAYIQDKLDDRNFPFPTGDSGFDGVSKNIDMAVGGSFADGAGHAMAWLTWRQNDALFQSQRDYSSCALSAAGVDTYRNSGALRAHACGGSNTSAAGSFYFYQADTGAGTQASLNADGSWNDHYAAPFNYAPLNYYQRPDTNYTFGASAKYEVNEHFKPYLETMYSNRRSATELAPSGTFFNSANFACNSPQLGSACADLGFDPDGGLITAYVGKRNIEGGPRHNDTEIAQFRVVAGAEGSISDNWSYNASFLYGRTSSTTVGIGDFLTSRVLDGLAGCPTGSFTGCIPYNVWVLGGVTAAAAHAMQGTSLNTTSTDLTSFNAYVTGDLGWGFGSAKGDNISLVLGTEWRHETFDFTADNDSQAGNFAGSGGKALPLSGATSVKELFMEGAIPIYKGDGFFKAFGITTGYRLSDYASGKAHTYKLGFNLEMDKFRVRGGYNRAIRAANIGELFTTPTLGLFGGIDACAGANPTATQAQCARSGITSAQYGHVSENSAGQYNSVTGGNPFLLPEVATTYTFGFVVTPIENLQLNIDAYDIKIKGTIARVGAQTILDACNLGSDAVASVACLLVHRNAGGNLWRSVNGFVIDANFNVGDTHTRGIDLGGSYSWDAFGGRMNASFLGTDLIKKATTSSTSSYDCAGKVNPACQDPKWRHNAELRYTRDRYTVNLRWRYYGSTDYVDQATGADLFSDKLLCKISANGTPLAGQTTVGDASNGCVGNQKLAAANYFDLSASVSLGEATDLTFGVNNIADKEPPLVGLSNATNGNAPFAYDQLGRFFFANITFKY